MLESKRTNGEDNFKRMLDSVVGFRRLLAAPAPQGVFFQKETDSLPHAKRAAPWFFFAMFLSNLLICVHKHSVPTAPRTLPYNYPFVKETHHPLISLDPLTLSH